EAMHMCPPIAQQAPSMPRVLSEAFDAINEARDGAHRTKFILRDMNALARPADRVQAVVSLAEVVEWSVGVASNEICQRARLIRSVEGTPEVLANESKLRQAVLNL